MHEKPAFRLYWATSSESGSVSVEDRPQRAAPPLEKSTSAPSRPSRRLVVLLGVLAVLLGSWYGLWWCGYLQTPPVFNEKNNRGDLGQVTLFKRRGFLVPRELWTEAPPVWHQLYWVPLWQRFHANGELAEQGYFLPFPVRTGHPGTDNLSIGWIQQGRWVQYYDTGQKKLEEHYQRGILHGPQRQWHENGQLKKEQIYRQGRLHGPMISWYANGQKAQQGQYVNGLREGLWTSWHENGQKATEGHFLHDKEHGVWLAWHENGQLMLRGQYRNGNKEGLWKSWYPNGTLNSELTFKDNQPHGWERIWDEEGNIVLEAHFRNGIEHGPKMAYYRGSGQKFQQWNMH